MSIKPEEHDYISQVCAEDAARRVPRRLSDDPVVRLAECQGVTLSAAETQQKMAATALDEAAERAEFSKWFLMFTLEDAATGNQQAAFIASTFRDIYWQAWLACARQKAEESK